MAKLVSGLLATAALWVQIRNFSKIQNGRHKQRSGQHTLASQKIHKKNYYLFRYSSSVSQDSGVLCEAELEVPHGGRIQPRDEDGQHRGQEEENNSKRGGRGSEREEEGGQQEEEEEARGQADGGCSAASCQGGLSIGRRSFNWSPAALGGSADQHTGEKVQRRAVHNKTRPVIGPDKLNDYTD